MSKEGAGVMDREAPVTLDSLLPGQPLRRQSSARSVRSVYSVRGNGKHRQEEQELLGREASGS